MRGYYEQKMYDIWHDQLKDGTYTIGGGSCISYTGKAGYVEFHIAMVKEVNKDDENTEITFKRIYEKQDES